MIFKTTDDEKKLVPSYVDMMSASGELETSLVERLTNLAMKDQGIFDLIRLWAECQSKQGRQEIIDDIKDSINDYDGYEL